ncbi:MAG: tetratricopeptide repeat protein [Ardenticatenaceae bacterium]|nr:tetratricopeptide repeat protein [Anaerolineales bacterium]MCB8920552.1 tetratricopeptide repeat protein [Ardenticatenaceae bacterium]MCB8990175.1 tetratricopeptide repeat protein [Ardenticatenaceae bacterium]MCB9003034.1 tetratricopeptide repeat protein [Ardenticatenaceae bacterium]
MDIKATIQRAKELRHEDKLEESQELLLDLLTEYPDDPTTLFEVGGSYDVLGEVLTANEFYQKALDEGLDGPDRQECLICLGINFRGIGDADTAVSILEDAAKQFPDNNSIRAFLALAYYSDGQDDFAVQTLLDLLLQTTKDASILDYTDTLEYYKDNLDEIWEE